MYRRDIFVRGECKCSTDAMHYVLQAGKVRYDKAVVSFAVPAPRYGSMAPARQRSNHFVEHVRQRPTRGHSNGGPGCLARKKNSNLHSRPWWVWVAASSRHEPAALCLLSDRSPAPPAGVAMSTPRATSRPTAARQLCREQAVVAARVPSVDASRASSYHYR